MISRVHGWTRAGLCTSPWYRLGTYPYLILANAKTEKRVCCRLYKMPLITLPLNIGS